MQFVATLLTRLAYFNPLSLAGWLVWFGLAGLLTFSLLNWRNYHSRFSQRARGMLIALAILALITTLFLGLEFTGGSTLPVPGVPAQARGGTLMMFSALPWTLAGGLLGPIAGAGVGMFSGLLRGGWDTHTLFSMLEFGLLGAIFSVSARQRYRTAFFRLLRQPLFNVFFLTLIHAVLFIVSAFFSSAASTAERLDFAFSNAGLASLTFGIEMLIAGFAAQILITVFPNFWGGSGSLQPSPAERSIEMRFVSGAGAIISILLILLLAGAWIVSGSAARRLLEERLAGAAQVSAQAIPQFLEAGQSLSSQIASDPRLAQVSDADLQLLLSERIQSIPFFNQLAVVEVSTNVVVTSYPPEQTFQWTDQEATGVPLIFQGILNQQHSLPPATPGDAARISFIAAIPNTSRALIARTDLNSNPTLRALVTSLDSMQGMNGTGILIDGQGRILHHSQNELIFTQYTGQRSDAPSFFDETSPSGTRQLVYYQPVEGHPWAVLLAVPARQVQQIAIDIALPIALMILLLGAIALMALRVSLRAVTGSLQDLAAEAKYISTGRLDRPLATEGADELSDLRNAFEQMRASLQARMDELNRLLTVSQGVASSLTLGDALQPVLEAIVASGASSARIVLMRDLLPADTPLRFADGLEQDVYMHLDHQIVALTEQQERVVMATLSGNRGLLLDPNLPQPESLIALALRNENRFYGTLWAAYNKQHIFTESDLKFMSTLASQSALAVANIRLFMTVEVSRRQLEAILNSTPDPVLVTDASNRLILANPAAGHVFGVTIRRGERVDVEKMIQVKALNDILQASSTEQLSAEVGMPDGKTYLAMTSPMIAEGKITGRVCVLRDVTQLKEIDTLKSDFVATVSHDLRSPLTLMRGYATMLEMAGSLNDQQKNYARMIVQGADNMAKLVNNLLDLGRIEFGVGLQVEQIPMLDILERVTGSLQMQAKEKNISLGVELPRDLPNVIEADQALLHQALYNLIENGIKYTPEGGTVTVHLKTLPDALVFAVQDSGIGISEEDRKRLFEKFFRGTNREALAQRGTGLGLAIVKSIAERHNGKVWVDSELGKGSVFFLQIPLAQE